MEPTIYSITPSADEHVEGILAEHLHAGFPSPAADYTDEKIDVVRELVRHPETTFYARVDGDSMLDAGIFSGDIVVVDRSRLPHDGDFVVACLDGEFTLKEYRLDPSGKCAWLVPHNAKYEKIRVSEQNSLIIWGVVTHNIHTLSGDR
ncbi:MAG: translesion error-prone DNA polymerase V autoproteolytic subunit [Paludibacteraceae bacterium]|nr:translesion error-prone DNA polymerase V autoproteolytic subunit [Paludibacteraceae bacterium]